MIDFLVDGRDQRVFTLYAYMDRPYLAVNFDWMRKGGASRDRLAGLADRVGGLNDAAHQRVAGVASIVQTRASISMRW